MDAVSKLLTNVLAQQHCSLAAQIATMRTDVSASVSAVKQRSSALCNGIEETSAQAAKQQQECEQSCASETTYIDQQLQQSSLQADRMISQVERSATSSSELAASVRQAGQSLVADVDVCTNKGRGAVRQLQKKHSELAAETTKTVASLSSELDDGLTCANQDVQQNCRAWAQQTNELRDDLASVQEQHAKESANMCGDCQAYTTSMKKVQCVCVGFLRLFVCL